MSIEVKERPILFSGPMVKAILEGRKTQTRREIKNADKWWPHGPEHFTNPGDALDAVVRHNCPYGKTGDRLWVRETFAELPDMDGDSVGHVLYRADGGYGGKWTPSIFMPRDYSRILLEITDVRVERLNEISEEDAIAEGIEIDHKASNGDPMYRHYIHSNIPDSSPWVSFESLWESINGKGSFDDRWVWVIEFKRLD